jgi:hypothetical protein
LGPENGPYFRFFRTLRDDEGREFLSHQFSPIQAAGTAV